MTFICRKPTKIWGDAKEWKKIEKPEKMKLLLIDTKASIVEESQEYQNRYEFWHKLAMEHMTENMKTPATEEF